MEIEKVIGLHVWNRQEQVEAEDLFLKELVRCIKSANAHDGFTEVMKLMRTVVRAYDEEKAEYEVLGATGAAALAQELRIMTVDKPYGQYKMRLKPVRVLP
ncbi:hypothetical protein QPK32_04150 [Massilia sp. YIM B02763]|uniref:hypothetical protein n=1 Tax=Massilia sp. YIM B02763 TaxID=3050130 RepID=UPI0025B6BA0C|nr:hypothetical protein [Massilia sp. YIM B02763]MDN4052257.1 hypothetical protein [Massilia sp. YIM B02763]